MQKIVIDQTRCKSCALCVAFCPKGALVMSGALSIRGVNPVVVVPGTSCSGCLNCAVMCPDAAIEIVVTEDGK